MTNIYPYYGNEKEIIKNLPPQSVNRCDENVCRINFSQILMSAEKIEKLIIDAVNSAKNNFELFSCLNVIVRNQKDFETVVQMSEEKKWNLICPNFKICLGKPSYILI
jgi:hypothetical protein